MISTKVQQKSVFVNPVNTVFTEKYRGRPFFRQDIMGAIRFRLQMLKNMLYYSQPTSGMYETMKQLQAKDCALAVQFGRMTLIISALSFATVADVVMGPITPERKDYRNV